MQKRWSGEPNLQLAFRAEAILEAYRGQLSAVKSLIVRVPGYEVDIYLYEWRFGNRHNAFCKAIC